MMIYNLVDYPIAIEIDGKTYYMKRDSDLELNLSAGTYSYCVYLTKRYGEPKALHRKMSSTVCYAESGEITCKRNTKVYIREAFQELYVERVFFGGYKGDIRYRGHNASIFDLTVEDGALAERRQGCLNERVYTKMLVPHKISLWLRVLPHLFFLTFAVLFGFGMFGLLHRIFDYMGLVICLYFQLLLIDTDIQCVRLLKVLKSVPILICIEENNYDHL